MQKLILILSVIVLSCNKQKEEIKPENNKQHLIEVSPTNWNTYIYINGKEQNPVTGIQQFTLNIGDTIKCKTANPLSVIAYFSLKDDGILKYQSQSNEIPKFTYIVN